MIRLSFNGPELLKQAKTLGANLGLATGDLRDLMLKFDKALTQYIKRRFDSEGPHWAPLRPSTRAARERGLRLPTGSINKGRSQIYRLKRGGSYYRLQKPLRRVGPDHPIGQWTGKARLQALKKGKAKRKSYERTFGKGTTPARQRLAYLHKGGKGRPPRPIYRKREVEKLLQKVGSEYIEEVIDALNNMQDIEELDRLVGAVI